MTDQIDTRLKLENAEDVHDAIFGMLEHEDCLVSVVTDVEPMIGGWSARIRTIGAPVTTDGFDVFVIDEQRLRTLHGVRRSASKGHCARNGMMLAWQGETDNPTGGFEGGTFQIWIGDARGMPSDVEYAFGCEHDKLVGEAVLERMAEDAVLLNAADVQSVMSTPHSYERLTEIRRVLDMLDRGVRG